LKEDLHAAFLNRVSHLVQNCFVGVDVPFVMTRHTVKRTELTPNPTHVGVVQNSTNDVGDSVVGCLSLALEIREGGKI
jgi:hypothetical protein